MCESQVSGCQFAAWNAVKAQRRPAALNPPRTAVFSST